MKYETLQCARLAHAFARATHHYVRLPGGLWCATLTAPANSEYTTVTRMHGRVWHATYTDLGAKLASAGGT